MATIYAIGTASEITEASHALREQGFYVEELEPITLEERAAFQPPSVILLDEDAEGAVQSLGRLRAIPGGPGFETVVVSSLPIDQSSCRREAIFFQRPLAVSALVQAVVELVRSRVGASGDFGGLELLGERIEQEMREWSPHSDHISPIPPAPRLSYAPGWSSGPPSSSTPPKSASGPPLGGGLTQGSFAGPTTVSPDLEKLLRAAEQRVFFEMGSISDVPSPEDEVNAILPADVLAALDDPLEADLNLDDEDDSSIHTPSGHATGAVVVSSEQRSGTSSGSRSESEAKPITSSEASGFASPFQASSETALGAASQSLQNEGFGQLQAGARQQESSFLLPHASSDTASFMVSSERDKGVGPSGETASGGAGTPVRQVNFFDGPEHRQDFAEPEFPSPVVHVRPVEVLRPPGSTAGMRFMDASGPSSEPMSQAPETRLGTSLPISVERDDIYATGTYGKPKASAGAPPPAFQAPAAPVLPEVITGRADGLHLVSLCVASRTTGSLCLEADNVLRRVILRDGDFLTCGSSAPEETLLSFLVERGELPRPVASLLSGRIPTSGRHAAAALIANGHLGQDQLWQVLRAHAEWLLGRSLLLRSGQCKLESEPPGRLRVEPAVFGGATGAEILLEVTRRVLAPEDAVQRLGGMGARVASGSRKNLLSECALLDHERSIVEVAGGRSVKEVLRQAGSPDFAAALAACVELGILEVLPSIPAESERVVGGAAHDQLDADAVRQRVRARLAVIEEGDYFQVLGVPQNATAYEIRRAYLDTRRSFEPSRLLTAATADLVDDVQLVLEVVEEAYEVLRDAARRERYRRAIEAMPPNN